MIGGFARREGQPVLFLGLLFAGWCLLRVLTWDNPWPEQLDLPELLQLTDAISTEAAPVARASDPLKDVHLAKAERAQPQEPLPILPAPLGTDWRETPPQPDFAAHFDTHRRAVGHNLLFAAGMANMPMPRSVAVLLDSAPGAVRSIARAPQPLTASPWRIDAWALLREGGVRLTGGERPASYGASQLGAVLAYRLAPTGAAHQPVAYARVARSLVDGGETEGALGIRARPLPGVPIAFHAEMRVTERPGRSAEIRPAAFLAGGFDSLRLPGRVSARGYGQAGFVAADFATAFADGAVVAERELARFDLATVSLGAGAWGGAQRGAARLDFGPSLAVKLELGGAPARIEADYRWRVAGNAEPGNGGVVTLSTGF
ncbi:hypothetical protein [Qipengyuania mesophila]|uniref:hypothetical protein n=1 Tax=Qipengyuania mesophila TaxID=2867246 RepID=UPI003516B983